MAERFILASRSPRRYELLKQIGLEFDVIPSKVDEDDLAQGEEPRHHVLRLSEAKALEVGREHPNCWVMAADTIVTLDGMILGKPKSKTQALDMLVRLSGREHQVLTGFSVHHMGKQAGDQQVVQTAVKFKSLTKAEMEWYVETGEPYDKAGGYGIQGIGSFMIESIRGSYTNVVGLPVCEVIQMLGRLGAISISETGIHIL